MIKGRPRKANSMMCRVQEVIERIGPSDADDVAEYLPMCDREQIIRAMLSLKKTKRLIMVERGIPIKPRGTSPSKYDINPSSQGHTP